MQRVSTLIFPRREVSLESVTPLFISSDADLGPLQASLETATAVAIDTETNDSVVIDGMWVSLRVISVATRQPDDSYQSFVLDMRDVTPDAVKGLFAPLKKVYAWNANFDDKVLKLAGCAPHSWSDSMITESVLWLGSNGRGWYSALSAASWRYLGIDLVGKGTTQKSFDPDTDLSEEQIFYASQDALVTMWVSEEVWKRLTLRGLETAATLEDEARPFIAQMMDIGIPFDEPAWLAYLSSQEEARDASLARIAELTGGGEITLFDQVGLKPRFNVNSDPQLREAFNKYSADYVIKYHGRLLDKTDKLDKAALKELEQLGCPLAAELLAYRGPEKLLSTYGVKMMRYVRDGRIRSRYKQALTATARLASFEPNAQNFAPEMKKYSRPEQGRVLVTADYSQAELRTLADLAHELKMIDAFVSGEDFHELTANAMFGVDMKALKEADPKGYKIQRTKTKRVNFGIPYGLSAGALGRQLTIEGVETSMDEAQKLLNDYAKTYVSVDAWLSERDSFVRTLAGNPPAVDWDASMRLLELWLDAEPARNAYKRQNKGFPAPDTLAELVEPTTQLMSRLESELGHAPSDDEVTEARKRQAAELDWAFTFDCPVVLLTTGQPLAFESRTVSGRSRLFMVDMDSGYKRSEDESGHQSKATDQFAGLVTSAMFLAATTNVPEAAEIRDRWAKANGIDLPSGVNRCQQREDESAKDFKARMRTFRLEERNRCVKAFEGAAGRKMKLDFVRTFLAERSMTHPETKDKLLNMALDDQVRKLGNAFRNHPIQGTVADIALAAFGELLQLCDQFPSLKFVQSVHDSIVAECDEADADEVAKAMQGAMERAMLRFCPSVPPKVDVEIRSSLDDGDIIREI